jgi:hypothetical protein
VKTPDKRLAGVDIEAPCGCGHAATCIGSYEGSPLAPGCDGCCGHGNEDGWCVSVENERHARELVAAEARGFARAREMAAGICDREAEKQREGARLLDLSTAAGRAARTYCEERERCADYLSDDIRAMRDGGANPAVMCDCGHPWAGHDADGCFAWHGVALGRRGRCECKRAVQPGETT